MSMSFITWKMGHAIHINFSTEPEEELNTALYIKFNAFMEILLNYRVLGE